MPFQFDQLKEFEIKGFCRLEYSDFFLEFINDNRMIEKLSFDSPFVFILIESGQLKDALPHLNYVYFSTLFH